jgi:hypothetical protein
LASGWLTGGRNISGKITPHKSIPKPPSNCQTITYVNPSEKNKEINKELNRFKKKFT